MLVSRLVNKVCVSNQLGHKMKVTIACCISKSAKIEHTQDESYHNACDVYSEYLEDH